MSILLHQYGVAQSAPTSSSPFSHKVEIRAQQNIPAGFCIPIHEDVFASAPHSNAIFAQMANNGAGDLRAFSDSGLTTGLPLEVISADAASDEILGWVRIPSAITSGSAACYLAVNGASSSQPAVTDTFGRNNVWQDYDFVSHDLNTDSTGSHTVSLTGTAAKSGASLWNRWPARGFDTTEGSASTDRANINYTGNPTALTVSYIAYKVSNGANNNGRTFQQVGGSTSMLFNKPTAIRSFQRNYDAVAEWNWVDPVADSNWRHELVTIDSSSATNDATFYSNGSSVTLNADNNDTGSLANNTVTSWDIGNRSTGDRAYDGRLGGFRIRPSTVNAAWAALEEDSYNDPSSVVAAQALTTA